MWHLGLNDWSHWGDNSELEITKHEREGQQEVGVLQGWPDPQTNTSVSKAFTRTLMLCLDVD